MLQEDDALDKKLTKEKEPKEEEPKNPQKDFSDVEGYSTTTNYKGKKVTIPTNQKAAEVLGIKNANLIETFPEVGFEYSGARGTLAGLKAVYDIRHDKVKVTKKGDTYIVSPKSGDSILLIKLDDKYIETSYEGGRVGFDGGTIDELNEIAREADTKEDRVLTAKELNMLIYKTFQAWKAKHPEIDKEEPESYEPEPEYEKENVTIKLESGVPVDYTLNDFRGKNVYDAKGRRVLVTNTGFWVRYQPPLGKGLVYDKYEIIRFADGKTFMQTAASGVDKKDVAEDIVKSLDALELEELLAE